MDEQKTLNASQYKKWSSLYFQGERYRYGGKNKQAKICYEKALRLDNTDTDLLSGYGQVLIELEQYDLAINILDKAIKIDRNFSQLWSDKGNAQYLKENYDEAIKSIKIALRLNKNSSFDWHLLGHCYHEKENYKKSIDCFKKETKIDPTWSHSWTELARSYFNYRDFKNSLKASSKALRIDKKNSEALTFKGASFYLLGKLDDASKYLQKSLMYSKKNKVALHFMGHVLQDQDLHNDAIKIFEKEILLGTEFEDTFLQTGISLQQINKFPESIKIFKKGLSHTPDPEIWARLGISYVEVSNYEKAKECLDKAVKIKKSSKLIKTDDVAKTKRRDKIEQMLFSSQTNNVNLIKRREKKKNVFLIHGHNTEVLKKVESHVKKLGLRPIILGELPSAGLTIIQKLEMILPHMGFAIVILTPDDLAKSKRLKSDELERARQNVILEYGMARAKLGRQKVCLIRHGNVEIPSDMSGIEYYQILRNGKWKSSLRKELLHAEMTVK